jgi:hypothetical protein
VLLCHQVQRRHQKVVEVAPSVGLPESLRNSLYNDAVKLCKWVRGVMQGQGQQWPLGQPSPGSSSQCRKAGNAEEEAWVAGHIKAGRGRLGMGRQLHGSEK